MVGTHRGVHLFTLGQRRGHGVASPREGMAYVVVRKEAESKRLVVAYEDDQESGLFASDCVVGSLSWQNGAREGWLEAQPRYRAKSERVFATPEGSGLRLRFERPQRALTPGQVCAFYERGLLLGGGIFEIIHS